MNKLYENQLTNPTNVNLTQVPIPSKNFWYKLKWLKLFLWNSKKLSDISSNFIKYMVLELLVWNNVTEDINNLKQSWKWVIVLNHNLVNFLDYLWIFSLLWEDILQNSVIYNWFKVINANRQVFSDYVFRDTIASWNWYKEDDFYEQNTDIEWTKDLLHILNADIQRVNSKWWYIIIIPNWENPDWEFGGIFKRIIKKSNNDLNVLAFNSKILWDKLDYSDILKRLLLWRVKIETDNILWFLWLNDTNSIDKNRNFFNVKIKWVLSLTMPKLVQSINSKLIKSSDFKWKNWKEQKEYYDWFFNND